MQPIDEANSNVVTFGKPRLVENFVSTEEEVPPTLSDIDPAKAQMYLSIVAAAELLMNNIDRVENFVMVASIKDPTAGEDAPAQFNIATSPIKVADFCLALKMLEMSLIRNMT